MGFGGLLTPISIVTAIISRVVTETGGFAPTIPSRLNLHKDLVFVDGSASSPTAFSALIYGADGSVAKDENFDNPDTSNGNEDNDTKTLLEPLKSSVGNSLVWNKIACAFAPPPHDKLTPELVRDAIPVGVSFVGDFGGIDIAVAVPASVGVGGAASTAAANQLVQILVHVRFPQAWAVEEDARQDHKVDALARQVSILEGLANDRLSERSLIGSSPRDDPAYYEKQVIEKRWNDRLQEEPEDGERDGLPGWWNEIAPPFSSPELVDEAKLLKKLLNEDEFEDELRALFVRHGNGASSDGFENNTDSIIVRAAVASVGSSGLFLKARVVQATDNSKPSSGVTTELETLASVAVAYSNPSTEAKTTGDLREGVLTLVESVNPLPMPAQPQAAETLSKIEAEPFTPFNEQVVELVAKQSKNTTTKTLGDDEKADLGVADKETSNIVEVDGDDDTATATNIPELDPRIEEAPKAGSNPQPRPPDKEAKLAAKYAAIEDLGERAFAILLDLGMV